MKYNVIKNIIGTFTILLVACGAFFLNSKTPLDPADVTLSDIIASNIASAEGGGGGYACENSDVSGDQCPRGGVMVPGCSATVELLKVCNR